MFDLKGMWYAGRLSLSDCDAHSFEHIQTTPATKMADLPEDVRSVCVFVRAHSCVYVRACVGVRACAHVRACVGVRFCDTSACDFVHRAPLGIVRCRGV